MAVNEREYMYMMAGRGVEVPCQKCSGFGVRIYGSTASWRGGIGGQALTMDVCDACWGTGDAVRTGANLRAIEDKMRLDKKRIAELEGANLAARRRLEALEACMRGEMPLGAHAALSCLRENEKGGDA